MAYLFFFYGTKELTSRKILNELIEHECGSSATDFKNKIYEDFERKDSHIFLAGLYFNGSYFSLGKYFRHFYQTVKFINEQQILNYKDKYTYAKMLRTQLSNEEQLVLFYNSLSRLGAGWEKEFNLNLNDHLITKYNLIKNIPVMVNNKINIKDFYPDVFYEIDNAKTQNRLRFENLYS